MAACEAVVLVPAAHYILSEGQAGCSSISPSRPLAAGFWDPCRVSSGVDLHRHRELYLEASAFIPFLAHIRLRTLNDPLCRIRFTLVAALQVSPDKVKEAIFKLVMFLSHLKCPISLVPRAIWHFSVPSCRSAFTFN